MIYEHHDKSMARTAVRSLRQAREQNNTAMSIISSDSRVSSNNTRMSEASSIPSHATKSMNLIVVSYAWCRKTLSTKILVEYTEKLKKAKVSILSKSQEPVTIMFDGWKNVHCQEILGAIILSISNQLYIWSTEDISNCSQKTSDVLNTIHTFFEHANDQNLNVVAMVTDSALVYASAQCKIRLQKPMKNTIGITSYFTDKRHLKAISLLRDEQQRVYKTIYSFMRPVTTRWNSYYYCFAMLLRSKRALQSYSILILNYLQHNAANLFDIVYVFGYVAQQYENDVNGFGYKIQQKLEKRWAEWEQPLLLLAIIFYLQYRIQALSDIKFFSLKRIM
ncbi:6979_t:CDS:2, partial [Dentiscutata erythropus]